MKVLAKGGQTRIRPGLRPRLSDPHSSRSVLFAALTLYKTSRDRHRTNMAKRIWAGHFSKIAILLGDLAAPTEPL
jgi:hypothetical protein